ncbi:MAG: DUF1801 domain-containing protein [Planctomycetota bacterium]|nr:DUF1801 domain-containing protein [Planctomycetota bacterium]
MQSKAATVAAYLKEVPAERRPALKKLRALIRAAAPRAVESMQYGMPTYQDRGGEMLFAFASQKGYVALYGCGSGLSAGLKKALGKADCGKGCIRFRKPEEIPFEVVGKLVKDIAAKKGA